ncbi:MAG: DUF4160 domain-containing protein [Candidatus Muirbacterium halophilum]|nr:DUF4160 domain-containing protein [Candidatus Muirbacterium halophilum]MCK9477333.1 DUF4160 domain-containing protein [Candidatus Muirbacterium halophilum]
MSPTIFREKGYRFFFFSNENNEPAHIHVEKDDKYGKIWLDNIDIAKNYGFSAKEINNILHIINIKKSDFIRSWNEYFTNK